MYNSAPRSQRPGFTNAGVKAMHQWDATLTEAKNILKSISGNKDQAKPQVPMYQKKPEEVKPEPAPKSTASSSKPAYEPFPPLFSSQLPKQNVPKTEDDREVPKEETKEQPQPQASASSSVPPIFSSQFPKQDVPKTEDEREVPKEATKEQPQAQASTSSFVPPIFSSQLPRQNAAKEEVNRDDSAPIPPTKAAAEPVNEPEEQPKKPAVAEEEVFADREIPTQQNAAPQPQPTDTSTNASAENNAPPENAAGKSAPTEMPSSSTTSTSTAEKVTQEIYEFGVDYYYQPETVSESGGVAFGSSPASIPVSNASSMPLPSFSPSLAYSTPIVQTSTNWGQPATVTPLYNTPAPSRMSAAPFSKRMDVKLNPKAQMASAKFQTPPQPYQDGKGKFYNQSKHNELTPGNVMFVRNLIVDGTTKKTTADNFTNLINEIARFFFLLVVV
jgi:hypothetical protein